MPVARCALGCRLAANGALAEAPWERGGCGRPVCLIGPRTAGRVASGAGCREVSAAGHLRHFFLLAEAGNMAGGYFSGSRRPGNSKGARGASRRELRFEALEARLPLAADFGDAPAPYPTTIAEGGAQHVASGPMLGVGRDQEADGVHSANADGDGADDDGVVFGTLRAGQQGASATVTVTDSASFSKILNAWIDFDGDGNWGEAGDQIANDLFVAAGQNSITFDIPSDAAVGVTYARFRLSSQRNLGTSGSAANGEIEDYTVTIVPPARAGGQFSAGENVATSLTGVQSAIAIDVDDDGYLDLVSADYGTGEVSWHRRDQFGAFTRRTIASGIDGAKSVFAADINGDDVAEVISASQLGNKLVWHHYSATVGFTSLTISDNVPKASSVVAADLDGDGDTEVISGGNNAVRWFEHGSGFAFTPHVLPLGGTGISSVAVANLDGDGDLDIIYAGTTSNSVGWYRNNGSESFTHQSISTTAMGASSVATADLDDDGDVDVLSANSTEHKIVWYENNGAQGFATRIISSTAMGAGSVSVADIDGDGDLDVLGGSATDNKIAWHQNDGNQTFVERTIATDASSVRSVGAADLDGDGDLDVFAAQAGNARVRQFTNRALGNYAVDSAVDGSDFLLWQRTLGSATPRGAGADGDGSGAVDAGDLALWRQNFGWVAPSNGSSGGGFGIEVPQSDGYAAPTGTEFLSVDLFSEPAAASPSSVLLAKQESQQSTSNADRDAALAALPVVPQAIVASNTLVAVSGEDDDSSASAELAIAGWGL